MFKFKIRQGSFCTVGLQLGSQSKWPHASSSLPTLVCPEVLPQKPNKVQADNPVSSSDVCSNPITTYKSSVPMNEKTWEEHKNKGTFNYADPFFFLPFPNMLLRKSRHENSVSQKNSCLNPDRMVSPTETEKGTLGSTGHSECHSRNFRKCT